MLALIGTAIFIRMNWFFKAVLNGIAFIIYVVIIASVKSCLFDNYDKSIVGICAPCERYIELKIQAGIFLSAVFVATVILGRSVSVGCEGVRV